MTGAQIAEDAARAAHRNPPTLGTLLLLYRELLWGSRSYRWARWGVAGVVSIQGLRLLNDQAGLATLHSALSWLGWLGAAMCLAFFVVSPQSHRALTDLALLSGLERPAGWGAAHLARLSLPLKPLLLGAVTLWACVAWNRRALESLPRLLLATAASCAALLALCVTLTLLAALSERIAPRRPGRTLALLVLLPALLVSALPELPSVMHAYDGWTRASIELLER